MADPNGAELQHFQPIVDIGFELAMQEPLGLDEYAVDADGEFFCCADQVEQDVY